jgi:hypothetical protein
MSPRIPGPDRLTRHLTLDAHLASCFLSGVLLGRGCPSLRVCLGLGMILANRAARLYAVFPYLATLISMLYPGQDPSRQSSIWLSAT